MTSQASIRRATHAGSWYASSAKELSNQLENWLNIVGEPTFGPARAVIAPHAGYQYCGACSAFAYKQVDPTVTKRVFILGPSHHVRLSGCALSPVRTYRTPFGDLSIDHEPSEGKKVNHTQSYSPCSVLDYLCINNDKRFDFSHIIGPIRDFAPNMGFPFPSLHYPLFGVVYDELYSTGEFEEMSLLTDEDEHSIEMHLPFIAKVMENHQFTIVPVLVGSLTTERENVYGRIFSRYLNDPSNLFVISSDFCHWGARFHYQYYDKSWGQIYESIEKLDEMGMNIIEEMSPTAFTSYLKKYGNTICGRHPIGVLLNAISSLKQTGNGIKPSLKFLKYAQSSKCLNNYDSSVSYAAASLVIA